MQIQPNTSQPTIDIPAEYIDAFLQLLELRTEETVAHSRRVAALSEELAAAAGLAPGWSAQVVRPAALLHDIGKIAFPDRLLTSASSLQQADRPLVEAHPVFAERALKCIPDFRPLLPIVRHVHERWDGSGYPDGLAGEEIPMPARLIAITDAFDAISHDRPYQPALTTVASSSDVSKKALHVLQHNAGTQFDPMLVYHFCQQRNASEATSVICQNGE